MKTNSKMVHNNFLINHIVSQPNKTHKIIITSACLTLMSIWQMLIVLVYDISFLAKNFMPASQILFLWCFSTHSRNFSFIWRCHHYRWRSAKFDLCSTLMAIEQWGFFSVPHLLEDPWHSSTSIAERLAVELPSLPVFTTWVCRGRDSNTQFSAGGRTL